MFYIDSVISVHRPGAQDPLAGVFLGNLTNKLQPKEYTEGFVSTGAKSYAYQINHGNCTWKVEGFTIKRQCSVKINFNANLSMLQNDTVVDAAYKRLNKRVKRTVTLEQFEMVKPLKVTHDRRRVVDSNQIFYRMNE